MVRRAGDPGGNGPTAALRIVTQAARFRMGSDPMSRTDSPGRLDTAKGG